MNEWPLCLLYCLFIPNIFTLYYCPSTSFTPGPSLHPSPQRPLNYFLSSPRPQFCNTPLGTKAPTPSFPLAQPFTSLFQSSVSSPPNFLSPLICSVFTHLLTVHRHEAFQQRSWSSLSDLCLLMHHLNSLWLRTFRLLFFFLAAKRDFPGALQISLITNACLLASAVCQLFKKCVFKQFSKGEKKSLHLLTPTVYIIQ